VKFYVTSLFFDEPGNYCQLKKAIRAFNHSQDKITVRLDTVHCTSKAVIATITSDDIQDPWQVLGKINPNLIWRTAS
jgi:hypothetical protein